MGSDPVSGDTAVLKTRSGHMPQGWVNDVSVPGLPWGEGVGMGAKNQADPLSEDLGGLLVPKADPQADRNQP